MEVGRGKVIGRVNTAPRSIPGMGMEMGMVMGGLDQVTVHLFFYDVHALIHSPNFGNKLINKLVHNSNM